MKKSTPLFAIVVAVATLFFVRGAQAVEPALAYAAPLKISAPGTYSGNYRSYSASVPAIDVYTSGTVVLENCTVAGPGPLIRVWSETTLVVRNCNGYGEGDAPGKFLESANLKSLTMENNYFENVSKGVLVYQFHGRGGASESIRIVGNVGRNMGSTQDRASFIQFNQVIGVSNVEIAWNQVLNEPLKSAVEDNINLYNSSGTAASPISVHDNYVQGAYPRDLHWSFSGSGMTTDGDGNLQMTPGNIEAKENTFVSTCNAAMNIAGGSNIRYHHNRMVSSSQLPDGSGEIPAGCTWAGTAGWNYFNMPAGSPYFANDSIDSNVIGFVRRGTNSPYADRQDISPGCSAGICHDNTNLANPVSLSVEKAEWVLWNNKLVTAQKRIGSTLNFNSGAQVGGDGGNPFNSATTGIGITPPTITWKLIGHEGDTLNVAAGTTLRYGSGTRFVQKVASGTFYASNGFFGSDPASGIWKEVDAQVVTTTPVLPGSGAWQHIAYEGETIVLAASTTVRFGVGGSYVEKTVAGKVTVTNDFFGKDPAYGVGKELTMQVAGSATGTSTWVLVGYEGQYVTVPANSLLRYGSGSAFVIKAASGSFTASNDFFGNDPVPGVGKGVWVLKTP